MVKNKNFVVVELQRDINNKATFTKLDAHTHLARRVFTCSASSDKIAAYIYTLKFALGKKEVLLMVFESSRGVYSFVRKKKKGEKIKK